MRTLRLWFDPDKAVLAVLFVVSVVFFMQDLDVHGLEYRDDEIFYVQSTREMLRTGDMLSPTYFGEVRFQKPILFYWLILLAYQVFGTGWFAARFIAVISASVTVTLTWVMAREFFDRKTAFVSAIILMTVPLFFRHAKNAVPDMTLNMFIVLAFFLAWRIFSFPENRVYRYGFFAACSLGFMIKGFAALIIPALGVVIYALAIRRKDVLRSMRFHRGLAVFLLIVMPWFVYMALTHGHQYTEYIFKTETLDRMVAGGRGHNPFLAQLETFKNNVLFYARTLMSYFAPWSLFLPGVVPLVIRRIRRRAEDRRPLIFLAVWFLVTYFFFSSIFARINHLILVLSTPFAVLTAYFCLYPLSEFRWGRQASGMRTAILVFFMTTGLIAVALLRVFLLSSSPVWLAALFILWALAAGVMIRRPRPFVRTSCAALIILFVYTQAGPVSRTRLTTHASLQGFAEAAHSVMDDRDILGVGSHDIHEKEFQVYFDRHVHKIATSDQNQTQRNLIAFFDSDEDVYCLLTREDYERLLPRDLKKETRIIRSDYAFRRRIRLDDAFAKALRRFHTDTIARYFLEELVLIEKPGTRGLGLR